MLQLIVLGQTRCNVQELEIFPANKKLGFDITLTHKDGKVTTCHNCTEFHFLHHGPITTDKLNNHVLACESDIHGTGYSPWDIYTKFAKIEVINATKLHDEF